MRINTDKCVACGNCTYVCPMGAIYVDQKINRATVDQDECVECYTCFNGMSKEHLNPTLVRGLRALVQDAAVALRPRARRLPHFRPGARTLAWPRVVRRAFSDPRVPHESTGVQGRGTEEVKTNDISGRVKRGEVGFTIEFGRPGVGVRFHEIQQHDAGAGEGRSCVREEEPDHHADDDITKGQFAKTSSTRRSCRRLSKSRFQLRAWRRSSAWCAKSSASSTR